MNADIFNQNCATLLFIYHSEKICNSSDLQSYLLKYTEIILFACAGIKTETSSNCTKVSKFYIDVIGCYSENQSLL